MYWYGWIPIMTSRLLFAPALKKIERSAQRLWHNEYVLKPKIDQLPQKNRGRNTGEDGRDVFGQEARKEINSLFKPPAGARTYYYLRDFDDIAVHKLKRVALSMDGDGKVKKIGIFDYNALKCIGIAEVTAIEENGLTHFRLENTLSHLKHIVAKQLFGEIRDIYHEHLYAPHGDFPLRPVCCDTDDREKALDDIFRQYQDKILIYHSQAKKQLNDIEKSYATASPRSLHDLRKTLCSAIGEMSYALSFASLFNRPDIEKKSIENAMLSFENLSRRQDCLLDLKSHVSNWMILVITLAAAAIAGYQIFKTIRVSILFVLMAFLFLRLVSFQQTKTRSQHKGELDG